MNTLSLSLFKRPKYTKILLDHLDKCYNIENYRIIICCEPGCNEVIELAANFRPNQSILIINHTKLGCNRNIIQCMDLGFIYNNFHIHIEDDIIPGKDFLLYCEWANSIFASNTNVFSVCGYASNNNSSPQYSKSDDHTLCSTRHWFTPWGWATWKNRWHEVRPILTKYLESSTISWDYALHHLYFKNANKTEVFPIISRTQNIGAEDGTFCTDSEWHTQNQYNEFWIESIKEYCSSTNNFIYKI